MKFVAILMVLAGVLIGVGAALEFGSSDQETRQFWLGIFTMAAGFFFTVAGILLLRRGSGARRVVLIAAFVMLGATVAATVLRVMGPPAALTGVVSSLLAVGWALRSMSAREHPAT